MCHWPSCGPLAAALSGAAPPPWRVARPMLPSTTTCPMAVIAHQVVATPQAQHRVKVCTLCDDLCPSCQSQIKPCTVGPHSHSLVHSGSCLPLHPAVTGWGGAPYALGAPVRARAFGLLGDRFLPVPSLTLPDLTPACVLSVHLGPVLFLFLRFPPAAGRWGRGM